MIARETAKSRDWRGKTAPSYILVSILRSTTIRTLTKLANLISLVATLACAAPAALAQANKPVPDTLIFVNGEQLTGALEKADSKGITFKSDMAGELTVKWANVKELRTDKQFALLTANQKLTRKDAIAVVPQGRITVAGEGKDKQIVVATAAGPKAVPLAQADRIVDAAAFDKAVNYPPSLLQGWGGTAAGGVSLIRATQDSTTFNGAVNLVRATPAVDWLPARSRSTIDYNQAYGTTSQAGTATVKTNIFHADAERDEYFTPRAYGFGAVAFDHNFSQSLALQQAYGGGVGLTVLKNARRTLDVKGDVHYEKQAFFVPSQNLNLFGSTFSEKYFVALPKALVFNEFASISPAYNQTQAYSAHVNASLGFPVYKGLGFNLGAVDDYLNNAPAGSKKNSVQYTTNLTYTIKPR